jgi:hypothetical protein
VPGDGPAPQWSDTTLRQRCILYEGLTGGSLSDVLNSWVAYRCPKDAPYWNRKGDYVAPLATAARSLLEIGLVEVWESQLLLSPDGVTQIGEGSLMLRDMAIEVVVTTDNWWQYDPDGNWDPEEDLSRYINVAKTNAEPATRMYTIIATQKARDLGLVRFPWW